MGKKIVVLVTSLAMLLVVTTGCETAGQGTATGALAGGALGAGAGALMGKHSGTGALVGGLAGAAAGGLVGNQLGKQNAKNKEQDQAIGQAMEDANTTIINVPTSTGGVVPVKLERRDNLWIGPRGETYTTLPTVDQLEKAYGF